MKKYRSTHNNTLYYSIFNEAKHAIMFNKDFNVDNIKMTLNESDCSVIVDALFDAIGLTGKFENNTIINESIISSGKKVNLYNAIYESIKLSRKTKKPVDTYIDEGLIGGAIGALAGVSFGPAIGKAICNALGIGKGVLYDLMTSKLVNAAVCGKLGLRF